eukprot:scaffold144587_cov17-Prasinocladus_malaysianus.AAC.1
MDESMLQTAGATTGLAASGIYIHENSADYDFCNSAGPKQIWLKMNTELEDLMKACSKSAS